MRACGYAMAGLMGCVLDNDEYVIVPLPTIRKHIRERGFDHIGKLARLLSNNDNLYVSPILLRGNNTVQVGASQEERKKQAQTAYVARGGIDSYANYLLLDDVWTTGSSMLAACEVLRACGCSRINVAVMAKSG